MGEIDFPLFLKMRVFQKNNIKMRIKKYIIFIKKSVIALSWKLPNWNEMIVFLSIPNKIST